MTAIKSEIKKERPILMLHGPVVIGASCVLDTIYGGKYATVETTPVEHIIQRADGSMDIITANTIYKSSAII